MDWYLHHDWLNQFPFPLLTLSQSGDIIEVNLAMISLSEYDSEELCRMSFFSLLPADDAAIAANEIQKLTDGSTSCFEIEIICKRGKRRRLELVLLPLVQQDQLVSIHVISRDITGTKQVEETLIKTQDHMSNIFDTLDVSIWSVNVQNNRLLHLSPGTEKIYKRTLQEFHENPMLWKMVICEEDIPLVEQAEQKLLDGHTTVNEYRISHPDGATRWIHTRTIPRLDENGQLVTLTGIVLDITERIMLENQIRLLAYQDELTGLPNRKQFEEILENEILLSQQTNRKMALLTVNAHRYKQINDTFGDQVADQSIKILVEKLLECVPPGSVAARIREDDFAVLVKGEEVVEEVLQLARQLIKAADDPIITASFEFRLFSNIGISIYPDDCHDRESMINHSAIALHRAKQQGINNVQTYTSSLDIESYQIYTLERDLYKAVERNEFTLLYQPKVDAFSHKIIGMEALLRWNHPEWGMVYPAKFIPIAEETDLIVSLGDWVLREACLQNKAWQQAGFSPVRVSVNFSSKQFMSKNMLSRLQEILQETQLDPKWLEIEITENTLLQMGEMDTLAAIKSLGVTISIDDFGTGYSSLSYIKKFKADVLKLDKSFIQNICHNQEDTAVVKAIVGMAHDLNISVIAEGVETKDQLHLLQKLKCHEIQGFLFSAPIAPDMCEKLLTKGTCPLPDEPDMKKEDVPNRRQFFRIDFPSSLLANMTVEEINGKKITIGYTEIKIENIGPGGLRFSSTIEFPSRPNVIYKIRTELMGIEWDFLGEIVWGKAEMLGKYHYGIMFRINDNQRASLIQTLNQLSVQLRRNPFAAACGFKAVNKKII